MSNNDDYDYSEAAKQDANARAVSLVRWWAKGYELEGKHAEKRVCEEIATMLATRLGVKELGR
jgi:hypothetical protein